MHSEVTTATAMRMDALWMHKLDGVLEIGGQLVRERG
jgi:hypothetical protein